MVIKHHSQTLPFVTISLFWKKKKQMSYIDFKGVGVGRTLFSQLDFILKSFIQATRSFLHISKI